MRLDSCTLSRDFQPAADRNGPVIAHKVPLLVLRELIAQLTGLPFYRLGSFVESRIGGGHGQHVLDRAGGHQQFIDG